MLCERHKDMLGKISDAIDTFNIKQGQISALLALPLLLVVVYEVRCHPDVELEDGLEWMEILDVGREPLDEVSTQVLSELYEE